MTKNLPRIFLLSLAILVVPVLWANEGGDQYPNGAENWFAGAVPPAGFYFINYFGYYWGALKNSSGNKTVLDGGTPLVEATFDAFRFVEMTNFKILGADFGMHAIVPVVYQSMNLGGRESTTGVGDIIVNPFILGWHHPQWHMLTGLDIYLPTQVTNTPRRRESPAPSAAKRRHPSRSARCSLRTASDVLFLRRDPAALRGPSVEGRDAEAQVGTGYHIQPGFVHGSFGLFN